MNFLKNLLSSFLGSLLAMIVGVFLLIVIAIGVVATFSTAMDEAKKEKLGKTNFLKISLNKQLVEYAEPLPFEDLDLPYGVGKTGKSGVVQILGAIDQAMTDDDIDGVFLNVSGVFGGYAQVKEIRDKVLQYKLTTEKPVYAYSEMMTENAYYLSSVADQVYVTPEGVVEFNGLSAEIMYYKNMLDKLEVKPKIFKVGKYKSAVEPYFREDMSEANREQISSFIESLYNGVIAEVAASRNMEADALRAISDSMKVRNIDLAVEYGLIDGGKYYDQVVSKIKEDAELEETSKIKFVDAEKYYTQPVSSKNKSVAVVVAEGEIRGGKSDDGVLGANTFVDAIRDARDDSAVHAIVVRLNSPGGSALASDVMWREIRRAAERKPVIASMSTVAASGGYYMAMACDEIVAEPLSITGSIGVFGVMFTLDDFLENKLGITSDRVNTGEFSDISSVLKDVSPQDSAIIQKEVERIYDVFTAKAAESRGMEQSELQSYAGGRVYSGYEAIEIGLVDTLGGLETAIELAAQKAELEGYSVKYVTGKDEFWDKLSNGKATMEDQVLEEKLGASYKSFRILKSLEEMKGVQARMPFELTVE